MKRRTKRPKDKRCKTFDYKKVEEYASTGASARNIAKALGCCEGTLYARLKDDEDFKEAYARGRANSELKYAAALEGVAFDPMVDASTRLKAITFSLERVHGWYKTTEVKADVSSVNANVDMTAKDIKGMSDQELAARIRQLENIQGDDEII